jgi:hypothetical protein
MANNNGELTTTLGGVSGNFLFNQDESLEDIGISFSLVGRGREDMSLHFGYEGLAWEDILLVFAFGRSGSYNFEDMVTYFEICNGGVFEDAGLRFGVIRTPQTLMVYIFEKLYCTTTEITTNADLTLQNWNVSPNQTWYVKVTGDSGSGMIVALYETLADMIAETNLYASGIVDSDTFEVILSNESFVELAYYYEDYPAHLTVSKLLTGTAYRTFKLRPLTDISEIDHAVYNNSNITISRGQAELDLHTYGILGRSIDLATHLPELECGDVVELNSTRRNKLENSQVLSMTISGSQSDGGTSELTTSIEVANYLELTRQ